MLETLVEKKSIDILDLDKVAEDICSFYKAEGREADYGVVRAVLTQWSYNKFKLFNKMGGKLIVSSDEIESDKITMESSFKEVAEDLSNRHFRKAGNVGIDQFDFQTQCFRVAREFSVSSDSYIESLSNIIENKAIEHDQRIYRFIYSLTPIVFADASHLFGNAKWDRQAKLTRQISLVIADMKKLEIRNAPFDLNRKEEWFDNFEKSLLTVLSEIKQSLNTSSEKTEFTISIHPYDFVTSSYNQQGWSSCFGPDGSYAKSVFSVMQDCSTCISYVPSTRKIDYVHNVELNSKKIRAFIHFSENFQTAVVSKVYPNIFPSYPGAISEALQKLNIMNNVELSSERDMEIDYSSVMYGDLQGATTFDVIKPIGEEPETSVYIGEDICCMACGSYDDLYESPTGVSSWLCANCEFGEDPFECPICGETRPGDCIAGPEFEHCIYCEDNYYYGEVSPGHTETGDFNYCHCSGCRKREKEFYKEVVDCRVENSFRGVREHSSLSRKVRLNLKYVQESVERKIILNAFERSISISAIDLDTVKLHRTWGFSVYNPKGAISRYVDFIKS